jgi:hypothetical protein
MKIRLSAFNWIAISQNKISNKGEKMDYKTSVIKDYKISAIGYYLKTANDEITSLVELHQILNKDEEHIGDTPEYKYNLINTIGQVAYAERALSYFEDYPGSITADEIRIIKDMQRDIEKFKSDLFVDISNLFMLFDSCCPFSAGLFDCGPVDTACLAEYESSTDFMNLRDTIEDTIFNSKEISKKISMRQQKLNSADYCILWEYFYGDASREINRLIDKSGIIQHCIEHVNTIKKNGNLPESMYSPIIKQLHEIKDELLEDIRIRSDVTLKIEHYRRNF